MIAHSMKTNVTTMIQTNRGPAVSSGGEKLPDASVIVVSSSPRSAIRGWGLRGLSPSNCP